MKWLKFKKPANDEGLNKTPDPTNKKANDQMFSYLKSHDAQPRWLQSTIKQGADPKAVTDFGFYYYLEPDAYHDQEIVTHIVEEKLPPLVALLHPTLHSKTDPFMQEGAFEKYSRTYIRKKMLDKAKILLEAGADPLQPVQHREKPHRKHSEFSSWKDDYNAIELALATENESLAELFAQHAQNKPDEVKRSCNPQNIARLSDTLKKMQHHSKTFKPGTL